MSGCAPPGPVCAEERPICIDPGTMCRTSTPPPGAAKPNSAYVLQLALDGLETECVNFAARFINDNIVRQAYVAEIRKFSASILDYVKKGLMSPEEGATLAQGIRNDILDFARLNLSELGLARSVALKEEGLALETLLQKYASQNFGRDFTLLAGNEQKQVFLSVIESSGRADIEVTARIAKLSRLGKGMVFVSLAFVVYNIATAENKPKALAKEGASLGAGILGGAAGGATAGLICGPGAPVCVTVGVFVGGALGGLGMDLSFDWLTK